MNDYLVIRPPEDKEEKVEVLRWSSKGMCYVANGILICKCGECKPKDYGLPEDYFKSLDK